jgi:FdrA protein
MAQHVEVRTGTYHDSVTLMLASRAVADEPGVAAALVAMGTELNLDLLRGLGFEPLEAGPNDLVIALDADAGVLYSALARVEAELAATGDGGGSAQGGAPPPRTVGSAVRRAGADLAVVSTPGAYAALDAFDALAAGASVMLFSDNVPVDVEVRLKDAAAARDLLVMGPDCGTAVVGGVGLGFANAVRPGPVGLVAASGTGAQQLMCLLDEAGVGVSHCLGVGGRDLSAAVGARSTLRALDLLAADPATELIVVVSKPPAPEVAERVRASVVDLPTPVRFALLGPGQPDLTAAAEEALRAVGVEPPSWPQWPAPLRARPGTLRGLFSGGTLCAEAKVIAAERLPAERFAMTDFGDDEYTRGRPHPMIDPGLRLEALAAAGADPAVGVVLLDVVLGHGAHPDPAADLAPAIAAADAAVVVALIGTAADPQDRDRQAAAMQAAGAHVFASNAAAARCAAALVSGDARDGAR